MIQYHEYAIIVLMDSIMPTSKYAQLRIFPSTNTSSSVNSNNSNHHLAVKGFFNECKNNENFEGVIGCPVSGSVIDGVRLRALRRVRSIDLGVTGFLGELVQQYITMKL